MQSSTTWIRICICFRLGNPGYKSSLCDDCILGEGVDPIRYLSNVPQEAIPERKGLSSIRVHFQVLCL